MLHFVFDFSSTLQLDKHCFTASIIDLHNYKECPSDNAAPTAAGGEILAFYGQRIASIYLCVYNYPLYIYRLAH